MKYTVQFLESPVIKFSGDEINQFSGTPMTAKDQHELSKQA